MKKVLMFSILLTLSSVIGCEYLDEQFGVEEKTLTFSGRVTNLNDGTPLENVRVCLFSHGYYESNYVYTDSNGGYTVYHLVRCDRHAYLDINYDLDKGNSCHDLASINITVDCDSPEQQDIQLHVYEHCY